jgi:DNA modification methylase
MARSARTQERTVGQNRLFYGDNLDSLRKHVKDETVDLCYIDPPFNSQRNYNQIYNNTGGEDRAQAQAFVDTWTWDEQATEGYEEIITNGRGLYTEQTIELIKGLMNVLHRGALLAYLVSMTRRIVEIHRVLKATGSFYFHCDPTSSHYLKLVLDGIFCSQGGEILNEIIWKRTSAHNRLTRYGPVHDIVLFYSKSDKWTWNPQYTPYEQSYIDSFYRYIEEGTKRRYRLDNITSNRPGGKFLWHGKPPPGTRFWGYSKETLKQFESEGRIMYSKGGYPSYKRYLDEMPGQVLQDIWTDIGPLSSASAERLGYPTQKPEALLERMIRASSNEGEVVLDAYCGCGTTIAVAHRLKRTWIGMDITYQSISVILKRLEDTFGKEIAAKVQLNGAPKDMASANALANKHDDRTRKEFEKWAILEFTMNRGILNPKKGADAGIDGVAYFLTDKATTDKMVFQVKSGHVGRGDIAKLNGDMGREGAVMGAFITLEKPTSVMRTEAAKAGSYSHVFTGRRLPRIQIVTIQDMLEKGIRIDVPLTINPLKNARPFNQEGPQETLKFS